MVDCLIKSKLYPSDAKGFAVNFRLLLGILSTFYMHAVIVWNILDLERHTMLNNTPPSRNYQWCVWGKKLLLRWWLVVSFAHWPAWFAKLRVGWYGQRGLAVRCPHIQTLHKSRMACRGVINPRDPGWPRHPAAVPTSHLYKQHPIA